LQTGDKNEKVSAFRPGEKHHVLNTNFPRNVIGKMNGAPPRVDLSRMRSLIEIKQSPYCHAKFAPGSVLTFNIHRLNWWCFADRILRRTLKEDASLASFTCLAVSENAGVVSLERIVEDIPPEAVENDFLRSKPLCERIHRTETMVERKTLWLFPFHFVQGRGLLENCLLFFHFDDTLCSQFKL
jgi:hypothetical protein